MAERSSVSLNPETYLISEEMLRASCLSILSIDLSPEFGEKFPYLPSYIEGQWVGGKPRRKWFLGSGWMHVLVSSSQAVVQHYIISFVIVCFGFIVVPGVINIIFLTDPLFVLYSMHCIPLLIFWRSVSP